MSLSKKQRDNYLHSMGVQPWSERLPIEKNIGHTITIDRKTSHLTADIKSAQPIKPSITTQALPKLENHLLSEKQSIIRFNLAFLAFGDLLIISELPLQDHKTITYPQLRLLKSIRLSLGYSAAEPTQTLMMNWPLVENNKIDQGAVAAFEAVQAQLKKQMEKYQPKYVVLMGAAACQYVLGLTQSFDELRGQLIANETLCAVITYGVNELLKVPSLKLSAWQDLQVIRKVSK